MFNNVHSTSKLEILPCHKKEWRQPNIEKMSNDARIITLKLNPSRGTIQPAPHGKGNKCDFKRTRQVIRYRATVTLRRLQIKQYTASNEGGGLQNQREHPKILIKYVVVHPIAISDNYSSSGMLTILIKAQTIYILSNTFAGKFTHIISKRTKWHIRPSSVISSHIGVMSDQLRVSLYMAMS